MASHDGLPPAGGRLSDDVPVLGLTDGDRAARKAEQLIQVESGLKQAKVGEAAIAIVLSSLRSAMRGQVASTRIVSPEQEAYENAQSRLAADPF